MNGGGFGRPGTPPSEREHRADHRQFRRPQARRPSASSLPAAASRTGPGASNIANIIQLFDIRGLRRAGDLVVHNPRARLNSGLNAPASSRGAIPPQSWGPKRRGAFAGSEAMTPRPIAPARTKGLPQPAGCAPAARSRRSNSSRLIPADRDPEMLISSSSTRKRLGGPHARRSATLRYRISSGALTPKIDRAEAKTRPTAATKHNRAYDNFRLFSLTKRKSRKSLPRFQCAWKRVASSWAKNATRCGSCASAA